MAIPDTATSRDELLSALDALGEIEREQANTRALLERALDTPELAWQARRSARIVAASASQCARHAEDAVTRLAREQQATEDDGDPEPVAVLAATG